jgi:hypothetical protein
MRLGMRNIIGNTVSGGRSPSPPQITNFLLWTAGSSNRINVRSSNNDKLVWI